MVSMNNALSILNRLKERKQDQLSKQQSKEKDEYKDKFRRTLDTDSKLKTLLKTHNLTQNQINRRISTYLTRAKLELKDDTLSNFLDWSDYEATKIYHEIKTRYAKKYKKLDTICDETELAIITKAVNGEKLLEKAMRDISSL